MNDITELVIIIDRSGSMHGLEEDVIGGFNSLIEAQRKEGKAKVTTIFFSDKADFIHEEEDIDDVKDLDKRSYVPSGCTALLDAIGNAIGFVKARHAKLKEEELPKATIFSIMTDGLENASREYGYHQIHDMIEMQKKCGWEFIFQAANIDVKREATRLGIHPNDAMGFMATSKGVRHEMEAASEAILRYRRKK
ncbi:MAG: hypothetical protein K6E59_01675 [Bacilli bacterium]|nr:hypothetical protein [Bacilli bacterium]